MKKLLIVLLSVLISVLILSCGPAQSDNKYNDDNSENKVFTEIGTSGRVTILKENKTNVMYLIYHSGYKGGITVMLDTDGKPLTYQNWKNK